MKRRDQKAQNRVFGLTGGIGSGKSLVASLLRKHKIPVLNLDEIGREITEKNRTLAKKVSQLCGENVEWGGTFDRARVREIVFKDPKKKKALEKLFHPLIWKAYEQKVKSLQSQGKRLVLCEAALLIENQHARAFDKLIVVLAPKKLRSTRVVKRDAGANQWLREVYAAQVTDAQRRKVADYLLYNKGTRQALQHQVAQLVAQWKKKGFL